MEARYAFHDEPNMFVSGSYYVAFENKEEYLAAVEKVKGALEAEFVSIQKSQGDFNPLQSPSSSIIWWAEDGSMLTFMTFVDIPDAEKPHAMIIKVAPRHPFFRHAKMI